MHWDSTKFLMFCFVLILTCFIFVFVLFCQIQFLHPTEVCFPKRGQKARNKESKYRKCQSRDKGDKPSTWSGRLNSSSQGLQAVTAQTTHVYSGGTSQHSALKHKKIKRMYVLKMFWNSCVVAEVINWLHVSLQGAPLALQPSCNMRPWSPESSLQKMKMQRNCYRWGTGMTTKLLSRHTCSINARHQLIQYKVIHRLHYSHVKLHSFFTSNSPLCVKCKQADGTLAQMFWFCSKLSRFWCEVFNFYSEVYRHDFPPDPETGILGWSHQLKTLSHWKAQAVQFGMVIAKKSILKLWNKDTAPTFDIWLIELSHTLHIEKIWFELSGKSDMATISWSYHTVDLMTSHKSQHYNLLLMFICL